MPDVPTPNSEAPITAYERTALTALGNDLDDPYPELGHESVIQAFRAGWHAARDAR